MNTYTPQILFERQLSLRNNFSSKYYSDKIVNSFYDSYDFLYKLKLETPDYFNVAIGFSDDGNYLLSGGTNGHIELWNINKNINFQTKPYRFENANRENFYKLSLNMETKKSFSISYRESFYIHDVTTGRILKKKTLSSKSFKCFTNCPLNSNLVAINDRMDGCFSMFDIRTDLLKCVRLPFSRKNIMSSQFHPKEEHKMMFSISNQIYTVDIRNLKIEFVYSFLFSNIESIYSKYNKDGNRIIALRPKFGLVLFDVKKPLPICEFDDYGFNNLQKSCCFAGPNDEYVVSGSLGSAVYVWKIPEKKLIDCENKFIKKVEKATYILKGHRKSINNVSYNYQRSILASSDSNIIFWSPFEFPSCKKNDKRNLSNSLNHVRIVNARYKSNPCFKWHNPFIFDLSNEKPYPISVDDLFLLHTLANKSPYDFNFNYVMKNYNADVSQILTEFKSDECFYLIKNRIFEKTKIDSINLQMLKKMEIFKKEIDQVSNVYIDLEKSEFLIQCKKFFDMWNYNCYFILYLLRQNILVDKEIKNLDEMEHIKVDKKLIEKKEVLSKIKLIIKIMICDIFILYLSTRSIHSELFELMKLMFSNLLDFSVQSVLKIELSIEIKKLIDTRDFILVNDSTKISYFGNKIKENKLFDDEFNTCLSKLEEKYKQKVRVLKKMNKESFRKVHSNLDSLYNFFLSLI